MLIIQPGTGYLPTHSIPSTFSYHSRFDLHIHIRSHAPSNLAQHRRAQERIRAAAIAPSAQARHLVDGIDGRLGGRLVQLAHMFRSCGGREEAGLDARHGVKVVLDLHERGQIAFGCGYGEGAELDDVLTTMRDIASKKRPQFLLAL